MNDLENIVEKALPYTSTGFGETRGKRGALRPAD